MKTYSFKTANWVLSFLTFFFSFIGGMLLIMFALPKGNDFYFILSFIGLIIFIIYTVRLTSFAKIEVTLEDEIISIKWLEQFIFSRRQDVILSFNEIATYINQHDINWDWLKIEMTNGSIYKIWHSNLLFSNDDYFKFVSAFVSSVKNHNSAITQSSLKHIPSAETIKCGKSIYETTGSLILAMFTIVALVSVTVLLIVIPSERPPNYFLFGLGYFGAIYFLVQVYIHRTKKYE